MDKYLARAKLIEALQNAHAGEQAAIFAYRGHWRSLKDPLEIREVQKIEQDEFDHRQRVGRMLMAMNARPRSRRERVMALVGLSIGLLCRIGGWFIPMYGAGKLEFTNIQEYEEAALLAFHAGHLEFVEDLLHMAEVEWDHEAYFRGKAQSHWLSRVVPLWPKPASKVEIRKTFERVNLLAELPLGRIDLVDDSKATELNL